MMADVYGNTSLNLIWLGQEETYTKSALSAIYAIDEEIREVTQEYTSLRDTLYTEEGDLRYSESPSRVIYDASALVIMFPMFCSGSPGDDV